ncbi:D-aminoacyl-tRNA deacylase [Natranaerobius trueperi]|uniref:D-aminoacyl-tRNA deacylase n=1 Tax=Natranaerobius trueperi TaxID=759412 RepID=A0A226BXE0_9FIRM|nr:D-aminoacyl-tRNA deacylase [Natranaerobius trueperi]OWZ83615.1 D-tyrosyl-tRNA(Tyr) deacylase [Natranaerobius trueperi]
MRAVIQRVSESYVNVDNHNVGEINSGLNVLLGVEEEDNEKDVDYMVDKIVNLRIFEDDQDKLNLSVKDVNGEILVVSQFTLLGDCRKGRRPNFMKAAPPAKADELYKLFTKKIEENHGLKVQTGSFQQHMKVGLVNDGPVTMLIDSKKTF